MARKVKFTKRKMRLGKDDPKATVWISQPPRRERDGNFYCVITTTTSGYYRSFLYKQVDER